MLLTISTTHSPATDLGYLLHKNPDRVHEMELSFGTAVMFYSAARNDLCRFTLALDIDPVALVRGKGKSDGLLEQYVNDRPYAASSFLSVAIAKTLRNALGGSSKERQVLADTPIPLIARVTPLPVRGDAGLLDKLFAPLGYDISITPIPLDETWPDWGPSPYVELTLRATCRLRDLLAHLYVLIPVLDRQKHYFVERGEIDKLVAKGAGWLAQHPERELIASRYLRQKRSLAREALARLALAAEVALEEAVETITDPAPGDAERVPERARDAAEVALETPIRLHDKRLDRVAEALKAAGARRIVDLGCGSGKLLKRLMAERQFTEILGVDISTVALEHAERRLKLERLPERQRARIKLLQGALTYRDSRIAGYDGAALAEVIEHLDPDRLQALERVVFEHARPDCVVITTPNAEYNALFEGMAPGQMRHADHRFEWTRAEFAPVGRAGGAAPRLQGRIRRHRRGGRHTRSSEPDGRVRAGRRGMKITIPEFCLVALVGTSGSGKSTFARKHFKPTEVIGSDWARGLVSDDENSLDATGDAFEVVHYLAEMRLKRRRLAVIDATNVRAEDRAGLVRIAKQYHALAVAIVINPGEDVCHERNKLRPDRQFGPHVVRNQTRNMKRNINRMDNEGFRYVHELRSVEAIDSVEIVRERLWTDRRDVTGPFDIFGDVHGCADELIELMQLLGYGVELDGNGDGRRASITTPPGRRAIFVGDLVDRGPRSPDVLRIVMSMVEAGQALCVPGNHDAKFLRWLNGRNVKPTHGLDLTIAQMEAEPLGFRAPVKTFLDGLVSHVWIDDGRLVVAHAGIKDEMIGRSSGQVREFCLYGETTGETDDFGLPIRYHWAAEYRGATTVVYGHTPVPDAEWLNNTLCIDTGCCFGGKLTALRWPEREVVSVPARATYAEPRRPFGHPPLKPGAARTEAGGAAEAADVAGLSAQARHDDLLDLADVLGKRIITTTLGRSITIPEANAAAALEVMSRFAISPKWLIHLPPTMSPSETTSRDGYLEHPDEAFAFYEREGVTDLVVEEKHMGSRALLVVCRDVGVARARFGVTTGETGAIFTRTGRAFFPDQAQTEAMLARVRAGIDAAEVWTRHKSDWVLLDAEIMPWSAKAQSLIREQYAATAAAARAGLGGAVALLDEAQRSGLDAGAALARFADRSRRADMYAEAYRRYCWPVRSLDDYRIAPFHLLASEGAVHMDKDHLWHMTELSRITGNGDPVLMATPHHLVKLADADSRARAITWWEERTAAGGEGMVVKPRDFMVRGPRGLVQPAIKCRGKEYLRIIYGPEYDLPGNLNRLRKRGLGLKRALAAREFALGYEALTRFVAHEPLRRVHECVFAILALESEPVDPRL